MVPGAAVPALGALAAEAVEGAVLAAGRRAVPAGHAHTVTQPEVLSPLGQVRAVTAAPCLRPVAHAGTWLVVLHARQE